ncbi:hypothetical protein L596_002438 [Steinernema carpocapsae]|uniref:Uncharacterized protein n=1 Tax=Steinernema carpocapsae TaxID=34508 RepID=A0A4U8UR35_STECR|nr:hypothetical protein L596_002438 [Steinernema carpocapsae]
MEDRRRLRIPGSPLQETQGNVFLANVSNRDEVHHLLRPQVPAVLQLRGRTVFKTTSGISKIVRPDKLARKDAHPKKNLGVEDPFPLSEPFSYRSRATGKSSILHLKQPILKRLARQGGISNKVFMHGFSRTAKPNPLFWNIPAPRPTFDNCWRYLTFSAKSLHAIALQLRVMFACIRWADLPQEEGENKHIMHGVDGEEQRVVIGHREHPPDGYYEQYKVRIYKLKDADDLDEAEMDECDDSEDYVEGRIRSGRRPKRKKTTKAQQAPKKTEIVERWVDGVDLKLWEIKNYWSTYGRRALKRKPADSPSPACDHSGCQQRAEEGKTDHSDQRRSRENQLSLLCEDCLTADDSYRQERNSGKRVPIRESDEWRNQHERQSDSDSKGRSAAPQVHRRPNGQGERCARVERAANC